MMVGTRSCITLPMAWKKKLEHPGTDSVALCNKIKSGKQ